MKNRIKSFRKELRKNQTDFGQSVMVSMSAVQKWESGENEPSDAVITLICQTYNVNEVWLRTGKGDMFVQRTREDEIATWLGDLAGGKGSDFQRRFVSVLARLTADEWELIERKARELMKVKDPAD